MLAENALMWVRRDLRLKDNHAPYRALTPARQVFCVFVFSTHVKTPDSKGILRVPTESRSALLFENREQNRIGMRRKRGEFWYATDEVAHAELAHALRGAGESQK